MKQNFNFNNNANNYFPATLPDGSYAGLGTGFPAPQFSRCPSNGIISPAPFQNYTEVNIHFKEPYVQSWNLAVQRSLPGNFVVEAAYVGNHGTRIPLQYNLNAGQILGAGAAGQPLFPKFGRTQDTNLHFVGVSTHYNALQMKLDNRRLRRLPDDHRLHVRKVAGLETDTGTPDYYIDFPADYARDSFDRTHTFVQTYRRTNCHSARAKPIRTGGVGSWLLGGWQVAAD